MALKKCKECGKEISSEAANCPNCGHSNTPAIRVRNIVVGIIVVFFMISLIPSCVRPAGNNSQTTQPTANIPTTTAHKPPEKQPSWAYMKTTDEMTGKPIISAITVSTNANKLDWPYGDASAMVAIRKHAKHGYDVIISISDGQILCNTIDNCTVSIRFDDRAAIKFTATPSADHDSKTLFISAAKFVREAKSAKKMKISIPLYKNGAPIFAFDISDLEWPPKDSDMKAVQ